MLATALLLVAGASMAYAAPHLSEQSTLPAATVTGALPQSAFRAARLVYGSRAKDAASAPEFEIPSMHAVRVAQVDKVAEHIDLTFDLEFQAKNKDTWPALFDAFRKRLHDSGAWFGNEVIVPAPQVSDGVVRLRDLKISIDASKLPVVQLVGLTARTGANMTSYIRLSGARDKVELGELKLSPRTSADGLERMLVEPPDAKRTYSFLKLYNFGMVLDAGATDACVTEWTVERIKVEGPDSPSQWTFALLVDHRIENTRPR